MKSLDIEAYIHREPKFGDINCSLSALPVMPKAMVKEVQWAVSYARKFNDEVVQPNYLELDRKIQEDPEYLPWDFVKAANKWGFYTLYLPKAVGGRGLNPFSSPFLMEELSSVCAASANLIGVHYLGFTTLAMTYNMRILKQIANDVVEGERTESPCLMTLAITEPNAGTDVEETELVNRSKVACHAKKVEGGYVVNGIKHFISNGHLGTWHMVVCYTDLKNPAENPLILAVKTGFKGFSFGRVERKMGQKGCPASELIFEDCFVPDEMVCIDRAQMDELDMKPSEIHQKFIDSVTSATRVGVAAYGAGAAKGAYERALQFASETKLAGKPMINHEWVQCMLAEMYKNWITARLSFIEGNYSNTLYTSQKDLAGKPGFWMNKHMPKFVANRIISPILDKPSTTKNMRRKNYEQHPLSSNQCASGMASLAKFSATDLGIRNCRMALQLMGQTGIRHEFGAEKLLRDAKLLQIYEGTNQLNRINLFKNLIGRSYRHTVVFDE